MLETSAGGEADPQIGKVLLDRYRLRSVLGQGGMGKVYLAEQKMGTALRDVAIKVLRRGLTGQPETTSRFYRECETVIQLHHPNTVRFYDFGELEDGTLFIVMEYIEGESLGSALKRGPIEQDRCDLLVIQICGSLQEAHDQGIIHRDLKPENILLAERGGQRDFVKVLDFGIAKSAVTHGPQANTLTRQGTVLGTPPYMSPEQFGDAAVGPASDIYAVGVVTYEMLTGRLPFEAKTPWEWATQHLTSEPRAIEDEVAHSPVAPAKKAAIMRALSKAPEARQSSALAFMKEFTGAEDEAAAWSVTTGGFRTSGAPGELDESATAMTGLEPTQEVASQRSAKSAAVRAVLVGMALVLLVAGLLGSWREIPPLPIEPPLVPEPDVGVGPAFEEPLAVVDPVSSDPQSEGPQAASPLPAAEPKPTKPPASSKAARNAGRLLSEAENALKGNRLGLAASKLARAARLSPHSDRLQALRAELGRRGANQVGSYLLQRKCPSAQSLYLQLKSAGAAEGAHGQFTGAWCPAP